MRCGGIYVKSIHSIVYTEEISVRGCKSYLLIVQIINYFNDQEKFKERLFGIRDLYNIRSNLIS